MESFQKRWVGPSKVTVRLLSRAVELVELVELVIRNRVRTSAIAERSQFFVARQAYRLLSFNEEARMRQTHTEKRTSRREFNKPLAWCQ